MKLGSLGKNRILNLVKFGNRGLGNDVFSHEIDRNLTHFVGNNGRSVTFG